MKTKVVIAGNGVLAQALAFELVRRNSNCDITLIGPKDRTGCASLAAGAMLNSFAELEEGSLDADIDRFKFELSREAGRRWPSWVADLNDRNFGKKNIDVHQGTIILNNAASDDLDDQNFQAIQRYLRDYKEPFETVACRDIKGYSPSPRFRALNAIFLPNEGRINPKHLFNAFEVLFSQSGVLMVDDYCEETVIEAGRAKGVKTRKGEFYAADYVILATGATVSKWIPSGLTVPRVFYGVGCSLEVSTAEHTPDYVVRTPNRGLACGIYQVPYEPGVSCIGATNFISPEPEYFARLTSTQALMTAAMTQLNTAYYRANLLKVNVGFRPTSADTYPILGKSSIDGLLIMSGTKRDGIHMAPVWSSFLADLVMGNKVDERLEVFKPERSLIHTLSREKAVQRSVKHLLSAAYQHDLELPKSGWEGHLYDFIVQKVEDAYERSGVTNFGIPPELLDMYRYGHIQP